MKKNKKGFTLIELLGVVVLIAIIVGLILPNVVNIIKKTENEIDAKTKKLIYNATDLTLRENQDVFPNDELSAYCLTIDDLIDYGYLIDNVKLGKKNIRSSKAVVAVPDTIENRDNYEEYSNGYGYIIVNENECNNYLLVPYINRCLRDHKCHICNSLLDIQAWGYIPDDIEVDEGTSYDFGDIGLGIKARYVSNEVCEDSKMYVTYNKLPEFSKSKAKSLGITYTSTSDYYSLSTGDVYREQVRKGSSLKRNLSKDKFSELLITNNIEYSLKEKILKIEKNKLLDNTTITAAYKVCVNETCTKVEKGTNYTVNSLPSHNALLIDGTYHNHTGSTYAITNIDKDYIIYTKTLYIVNLNGSEYGRYEVGSNVLVDLSHEEEFNTVSVNGSGVTYNTTNLTYQINNISEDTNIVTKMMYTITYKNFLIKTGNPNSIVVEKGMDFVISLYPSNVFSIMSPFESVSLTAGTDYVYNKSDGSLSIINVNQNITVTGYYKVDYVDRTFGGSMGWSQSGLSSELVEADLIHNNIYFEKNLGSYTPERLEVSFVGDRVLSSSNYTYNNGVFSVSKPKIGGNMTITAYDDDVWVEPPELYNGILTPVVYMQIKYSNSGKTNEVSRTPVLNTLPSEASGYYYRYEWVIADPDVKYYRYKKQIWANAVVLTQSARNTKHVGDIVDVDPDGGSDALAMYVWIPRFSYTIKGYCCNSDKTVYKGRYFSGINQDPDVENPVYTSQHGAVDIKFISKSEKDTSTTARYTGSTPSNWLTPKAFTVIEGITVNQFISGSTGTSRELAGVWIAKFKASDITNYTEVYPKVETCTSNTCSTANNLRFLPNIHALKNSLLRNMYYTVQSMMMTDNVFNFDSSVMDSHVVTNNEWSLMGYLSTSIYGIIGNPNYDEVNVAGGKKILYSRSYNTNQSNGNVVCFTGNSLGRRSVSGSNTLYKYNNYSNFLGVGASTTGNIYGVYDIPYNDVMGIIGTRQTGSNGFSSTYNILNFPVKYVDFFASITALESTKGTGIDIRNWNGDSDALIDSLCSNTNYGCFILRGGSNNGLNTFTNGPGADGYRTDYGFRSSIFAAQ